MELQLPGVDDGEEGEVFNGCIFVVMQEEEIWRWVVAMIAKQCDFV